MVERVILKICGKPTYDHCCLQAIYLMTDGDNAKVIEDAPLARTRDIFCKMDLNRDGVLSKDEFIKGCINDETLYKLLACSGEEPEEEQNG